MCHNSVSRCRGSDVIFQFAAFNSQQSSLVWQASQVNSQFSCFWFQTSNIMFHIQNFSFGISCISSQVAFFIACQFASFRFPTYRISGFSYQVSFLHISVSRCHDSSVICQCSDLIVSEIKFHVWVLTCKFPDVAFHMSTSRFRFS